MNLTSKIQLRVLLRGSGITESTDVAPLAFDYRSSQSVGKIISPAHRSLVSVRADHEFLRCDLTPDAGCKITFTHCVMCSAALAFAWRCFLRVIAFLHTEVCPEQLDHLRPGAVQLVSLAGSQASVRPGFPRGVGLILW